MKKYVILFGKLTLFLAKLQTFRKTLEISGEMLYDNLTKTFLKEVYRMAELYLIGNAHLDPVWLWQWREGFAEILATYRSALDRMKEFPDFKFTSACAGYYEWVEKVDPQMFAEIQQRVAEGRWGIVGGWLIQPDCNLPDGESFARHALISQNYFQEKFGTIAKTGYNVDSFGHNASLPKILRESGMENYVFMRPSPEEGYTQDHLFQWESDDGSRVTAFRIFDRYCKTSTEEFHSVKDRAEADGRDYMVFYGVGNHGGGPTIKMLQEIQTADASLGNMIYATPDEYFDRVDKTDLPVIHDELQHHARGCYSVNTVVKSGIRKCENQLLAAEAICTMAKELTGAEYPTESLKKAWKNVLFNQFHDIAGGCSIQKAYEDAKYLFGETMAITDQAMTFAMQRIVNRIDTLDGHKLPAPGDEALEKPVHGTPIVLFNPHPWAVEMPIEINSAPHKVCDADGNEILSQNVRRGFSIYFDGMEGECKDRSNTVFLAKMAPYSYAVYRGYGKDPTVIVDDSAPVEGDTSLPIAAKVTDNVLENNRIRVEFSKETGDICKIYDKDTGSYLLDHVCKAILLDETYCDTWAHAQKSLGERVGVFGNPVFEIIDEGPVRATLRVTTKFGDSTLRREYSLHADDNEIRVATRVDFYEKHRTLKFTFPMKSDTVLCKIPYGTICRPEGTGEEPCGSWLATGDLCVLNDGKYAYDAEDGELRMTVLRTSTYADHGYCTGQRDAYAEFIDFGTHEFRYAILPFADKAQAERKAKEFNQGLLYHFGYFHTGDLPQSKSFFSCDADNVIVSAIKTAENGKDTVLRLYEMNGEDASVTMHLFDKTISAEVSHHQIRTWNQNGDELDLLERKK